MKKETIIFAPATFNFAETSRMVEIAKELRENFECLFFGFSDKYSNLIIENSFDFQLLEPMLSENQVNQIIRLDQLKGIRNPFTKEMVAKRVANELAFLKEKNPKIIVTGTNITIFLSARIAHIPLIYVKPYALSRPFYEAKNKKTFLDTILMKAKWIPSAFKKVAKNYDLILPKYTLDLLDGDFNYITTSPMFYDIKSLPNNYFPIGPIYAEIGNKVPDDVTKFINNARILNKKIVYFASGSSGNKKFVTRVLRELLKHDFHIIAPVKIYLGNPIPISNKLLCTDWLPAHLVAPLVDFSIIHGGEGTVQTACKSGKPFIGFGLQMEQKISLSYCEKYGNAIFLKPSQVTSKIFSAALKEIQQVKYLKKAEQLRITFEINGAENAEKLIKDLIK
jgi:UDP:flavonoid glycosyltransferase YjiC (YdhE family)